MKNQSLQLIQISPEELKELILEGVKQELKELKRELNLKKPEEYMSRQEVAEMLKVDVSTVHNWTVQGILTKYKFGHRVLYKRSEIEKSINSSLNGFFED